MLLATLVNLRDLSGSDKWLKDAQQQLDQIFSKVVVCASCVQSQLCSFHINLAMAITLLSMAKPP